MTALELKNQAVLTLLRRQPFMFHLVAPLRYEETDEVPTAAVVFDGVANESWLKVNPDYVTSLTALELEGLLAHEIMHVLHDHTVAPHVGDWTWNIAADLAVNTILLKQKYVLPQGALTPESVAKQLSEELQRPVAPPEGLESAYWYYRWLHEQKKENQEEQSSCGSSGGSSSDNSDNESNAESDSTPGTGGSLQDKADPHAHWNNQEQEQDKELNKRFVAQHVQKAMEQSNGSIPGYLDALARELLRVLEEPKVRWNKLLKRFVGFKAGVALKPSSGRENKYGQVPKIVFRPSAKFMVFVDVSGSVDNKLASKFFSELEGLSRQGYSFDTAQFSVSVAMTGKFKKGLSYQRKFCGGTNFHVPFEWLREEKLYTRYDGVIILTDGEADWPSESEMTLPTLWVLSQEMQTPAHINSITIED